MANWVFEKGIFVYPQNLWITLWMVSGNSCITWREIRIFVTPEKVTDLEAKNMARDIANKIEKDLKYPGEIKVTIIRETRVIDFAR